MVRKGNTEKVSVTLPRELAGEIRSIVPPGEVSSFVTEALRHYLVFRRQTVAIEKGYGAWKDENHPDLNTPEDSVRYVDSLRGADRERLRRQNNVVAE